MSTQMKRKYPGQNNNCPNQSLFSFLPVNKYASRSFIKKPYNLVSLAILLLDPAAPGVFLNIPPLKNESVLGRGVREAAQSDIYILIVAIIKLAILLLITVNFLSEKGDFVEFESIRFIENPRYLRDSDTTLVYFIKIIVPYFIINMVVPIICIVVNDLLNDRNKFIKKDVTYLLTTRKIWAHALVQSGVQLLQFFLIY